MHALVAVLRHPLTRIYACMACRDLQADKLELGRSSKGALRWRKSVRPTRAPPMHVPLRPFAQMETSGKRR